MLKPTRREVSLSFLISLCSLALPIRARADHDNNILSGPFGRGEVPYEVDFEGGIYYDVWYDEYKALRRSQNTYGGCELFLTPKNHTMFNQSSIIVRDTEPSLTRLTDRIVAGLSTQEQKAQELFDFVTTAIRFESIDHPKKPHEILIDRKGDCTEKSTLLASLLEQVDIPYCLLYFNPELSEIGHANVGIPGNFSGRSCTMFEYQGVTYTIVEIAIPGSIGSSTIPMNLLELATTRNISYIQLPGEQIVDFKTEQPLDCYNP